MNNIKTIGIPCLLTCAVGVIIACYVFPAVLAMTLAMALPLLDWITDGIAYFWALSFLQMVVLIILYITALLLLLKYFRGRERLVSLSFAFVVSVSLLFMHRHVLHNSLLLSELIIEVFLIVSVSLIIVWKKTKQPLPPIHNKRHCSKSENPVEY